MPKVNLTVSKVANAAIEAEATAKGVTVDELFAPYIRDIVSRSGASEEDDEATQLADIAARSTRVAARKAAKLAAQG